MRCETDLPQVDRVLFTNNCFLSTKVIFLQVSLVIKMFMFNSKFQRAMDRWTE